MARPSKHDGAVFRRNDGKILWIRYRDREGNRVRESTFTEDWPEAQRKLRERLQARDDKILEIVRKGLRFQFPLTKAVVTTVAGNPVNPSSKTRSRLKGA